MRLTYPRLFLRTAIHIGSALAAFVLIGAASLGLIAAWELRGYVETRQSTLAQEAGEILAAEGIDGLRDWLEEDAAIPSDVSIYILDQESQDILGRTLPEMYSEFVRDSVIGKPADPAGNFRPVRLAPQIIAPSGDRFAFLVLPKGISIWGSPATMIGLLIVALLVIASVAWLMARAFSRPISELQLAVRELASGNTAARVPARISRRHDELGALAADFNQMASQLSELIAGREALLREMSHELRSPLARLQAAIALAAERQSLPETERERIEQEIGRMNRVIGEMLRYSSLQTTVSPKTRLVKINRLLKELVNEEEIEATNRGCKLDLTTAKNLVVIGDPELLHSCFENILRNAIRYGPDNSTVTVTAAEEATNNANNIIVEISDKGPGVADEHLQRIFEPYFRTASGNHDKDSTGLGLAIVKRVVESHSGDVRALNQSDGGLLVRVSLPAADLN